MDLTVGPNFFFWPAETVRAFYRELAPAPVARVVLGELVCSKRLPFWQGEIPGAVETLLAAGKEVAMTSLALITLKRERKLTADLQDLGLPVEVNDLTALAHVPEGRPFWVGPLVNVYNEGTLRWLIRRGARRICLPPELTLALRFILDHAQDLTGKAGPAQEVAMELIAVGLRRELACPAPATLDRRIASWQAFHRMRNLPSPFSAPLVQQARQKARRANARPRMPKSAKPVTRDTLETLLATCDDTNRGIRDRAMLMLAFASGGRRRSEVTALNVEDIGLDDFVAKGVVWIRLLETKTTKKDQAPRLPMKGRAARALVHWLEVTKITDGPLFRPVSLSDRPLPRRLASDALRTILRHRLTLAGLPVDFATPHGLRAGFLTQAALDGAPLAAAMKLSLHRSAVQAQKYYADVEISENPATDLLGD